WSIIARDKATGAFGIAVATKFFAAGARVPFIAAGVGAVATQALINPFYGSKGLQLLRAGMTADAIVKALVADDPGRDHRQVHVMDASGLSGAHTGAACIDWNGHLAGDTFSIAGNMLADAQVLDATVAAYVAGESMPFARRLIAAMRAGEAAGGGIRRKQTAALPISGEYGWTDIELRVDDDTEPLAELERLEGVSRERWTIFRRFLPSRRDPVGVTDRTVIEREIARELAAGDRR